MRNLIVFFSILFSFYHILDLSGQDECWEKEYEEKLEVTKMAFNNAHDTIYITIRNNCSNCTQSVYSGIVVYKGVFVNSTSVEDTLAIDKDYTSERSPENNSERTYKAVVKKDFDFEEDFKVGLVEVCKSIPLAPDVILNLKEESISDKKKLIIQNNRLLMPAPDQSIKYVSIYNLSGQLALKETAVNNSFYDLKVAEPGVYLVSATLSSGEEVNLKYVNY